MTNILNIRNKTKNIEYIFILFFLIIFNSSFIEKELIPYSAIQINIQSLPVLKLDSSKFSIKNENINLYPIEENQLRPAFSSSGQNIIPPFFRVVYIGNGVDHMSINLVEISSSGLQPGDEIGIFDSIYCVGSVIISDNNILNNNISIPASANDTVYSSPNGYIEGHKIILKIYHAGSLFQLYFELVNNSQDIFQKGSSMFAIIDISRSTGLISPEFSKGINVFPNPFSESLTIDVVLQKPQHLSCEIFDITGKLIRTLFNGEPSLHTNLIWDTKDNSDQYVPAGIYFCRINQTTIKVIYNRVINP